MTGYAIGIDLGTSNTVAVLRWPDGRSRPLLFDGNPVLPSAVYLDDTNHLRVGRDAQRLAQLEPANYEPNPKRRIDDGTVLLGDRELPVAHLLAGVLATVAEKAVEACGSLPAAVLTYPVAWGPRRRGLLLAATGGAGWPEVRLVPEPIAAARYYAEVLGRRVATGGVLAVFDFGGGTVDVAVVRHERGAFQVLGSGGIDDLGGLDIDAALVDHVGRLISPTAPDAWDRLVAPRTATDRRHRRLLWDDVRTAKEMLSRLTTAPIPLPGADYAVHLTRDEVERVAGPLLRPAIDEAETILRGCGLAPGTLDGVFLVGGASRMPLISRLVHAQLGVPPTVLEQPEFPVAEGALLEAARGLETTATQSLPAVRLSDLLPPVSTGHPSTGPLPTVGHYAPQSTSTAWPPAEAIPVSGQPFSVPPVSGPPVSGQPYSGAPASGPPVSGQPYSGAPAGGPPVSGQPYGGPPASGQPFSGPPAAGAPVSGQPFPGAPVSGQPYSGQPYSGPPVSGPPVSGAPAGYVPVSPDPTGAARINSAPVSSAPVSSAPVSPGAYGAGTTGPGTYTPRTTNNPGTYGTGAYGAGTAEPGTYGGGRTGTPHPFDAGPVPDGRRQPGGKRRAVPIIAGLLVLALLGALGYWLLNKKEGGTGGTATEQTAGPTPGPSFSALNEVALGGPGAGSGIAFAQDLFYVATPAGSHTVKLFAYDAKSAKVLWEKPINGADKPREMIAGPEGILVRTSREGSTTAPLVYFKSDGTPGASLTGSDGDTPRLVGDRIVMIPPGSNTLAGYDASSGTQIWNRPWNSNGLRLYAVTSWAEENRPISLNGWVGQGAPHELRRLVLLDGSHQARSINTDNGAIDDTSESNWGIDDKILGYDGNLYVSAAQPGAPIRAYKLTDLQNPIWTLDTPYPADRPNWFNVCGKRLICMLSHDGTVEDKFNTPRQSAHLSAIDLDTHKVKWQHALPYLSYVAAVGDKTLVTYTDKTVTSELIDAAGNRKPLGEYRAIRADASTAILLTATADPSVTAALQASRVNATAATVQLLGQVHAIPNKAIATADFLACLGDTTFRLWRIPPP